MGVYDEQRGRDRNHAGPTWPDARSLSLLRVASSPTSISSLPPTHQDPSTLSHTTQYCQKCCHTDLTAFLYFTFLDSDACVDTTIFLDLVPQNPHAISARVVRSTGPLNHHNERIYSLGSLLRCLYAQIHVYGSIPDFLSVCAGS